LNNFRHAPSLQLTVSCKLEVSGSPGMLCVVCHHVRHHLPDYGTGLVGTQLQTTAQIAKLDELTVSESTELTGSMVDETALTMLRAHSSQGNQIVS
jgi:hypothetical protein